MKRLPRPRLATIGIVLFALLLVTFVVGLALANERGEERSKTVDDASTQNDVLNNRVAQLEADNERARTQANASVDQLVKSGQDPVIAAPDVITVPTTPETTTTLPPVIVTVPVTQPPSPPLTQPPITTTTTTEAPPPETTTTTTEPPPPETTTTTTEPPQENPEP